MPKIFTTLDKIKPAYDVTYKVVLFICKILLIVDILITTMSVVGRYVPFIPDPAWSEEVVLTLSLIHIFSGAMRQLSQRESLRAEGKLVKTPRSTPAPAPPRCR